MCCHENVTILKQSILMNLKLLLNTPMIFIIFITNIEEYDPNKKLKILIVFGVMMADMLKNKTLNPIETELFMTGRKLIIFLVFITQSYFTVPKNIRLILQAILFWKFQINKNLHESHSILHQILTLKTLWTFTKKLLQKHILF